MTKQPDNTSLREKLFTMAADDSLSLPNAGSRVELLEEKCARGAELIDDDEDEVLVDDATPEGVSDIATEPKPHVDPDRIERDEERKQLDEHTKHLQQLVAKANAGDPEALAELRPLLDKQPEIWMALGNLARHAEDQLINLVAGGNALVAAALEKHLNHLNSTLLGNAPTPLEVLSVQRVVAAYLHCQYADLRAASADGKMENPTSTWAKRQELAEKRYERALKSLKLVRQMLPEARPAEATKSQAVPSKTNGRVKAKPVTDSSCPPSTNGHHNHYESNGHGKTTVVPKVNGKPVNRLAAATARTMQSMRQE